MAEEKTYPSQYEKVKAITDQLEAGIAALFESDAFKNYLTTLSKFHDYSLNNTLLIAMQKPDATLVAGYTAWQKQFGRQVLKGAKAIRILAPTPYKKKVEVDKTDPHTGEILFNPDGSTKKEVQEVLMPAFKVVSVFDVSQTEGRELPSIGVNELTGDVTQFADFFEALKRTCPVPIDFEQIDSGAKGYFHTVENRIAIQEGMSQVQTAKTAIHEMAHQKLHSIKQPEQDAPEPTEPVDLDRAHLTRNRKEVEAEAVAFTVCQHYGIDTSDYSFAYIAGWSHGKETPELKASLDTIRKAAGEMITEIDGHMQDIRRERGIEDPVAAQPDPSLQENGRYRYYSTQRPVDLGTFPKPEGNAPVEIQNFVQRQPVENGQLRAWGYLEYAKPLTEKQCSDYELSPAPATEPKKSILSDLQAKKAEIPAKPAAAHKPKHKEESR